MVRYPVLNASPGRLAEAAGQKPCDPLAGLACDKRARDRHKYLLGVGRHAHTVPPSESVSFTSAFFSHSMPLGSVTFTSPPSACGGMMLESARRRRSSGTA